jgi:hypothetical protein
MKKADLKQVIKPLVKECIHEILLEEGLLSNVVAEVAKGLQTNVVLERAPRARRQTAESTHIQQKSQEGRQKMQKYRKDLMESIGTDAYNGVNLFEGTSPIQEHQTTAGHTDLGNPTDGGVDISNLVGGASQIWQALK